MIQETHEGLEAQETPERNKKGTLGDRKKLAEHLFITTNLTQNEIADIASITAKTMSSWVLADGEAWKNAKAARSITKERVIAQYYRQLYELNKGIEERGDGKKFPTSVEADTIAKLSTTIERLEKSLQYGIYFQVMDEMMEFLSKRDAGLASQLALHTLDFVKHKMQRLNGKSK
jgi:hypothetical protein